MSCTKWEQRVALYVEGDCPDAGSVETHLRQCAVCRELAEALRESQAALKSLREEQIESAALGQVRRRVLEQVAAEEPGHGWGWAWQLALAGVLMAVVGGWVFWRSHRLEPAAPPPVTARVTAPERASQRLTPQPAAKPRARRTRAVRPPQQVETEPLMVKLATDDPNVVIIWLVDRDGGEE